MSGPRGASGTNGTNGQAYEDPGDTGDRLAMIATAVLGVRTAEAARKETAWSALVAALHRAENVGLNAADMLAESADSPEIRTAESISEAIAVRINHRLEGLAGDRARNDVDTANVPAPHREGVLPWVSAPHGDRDDEGGLPGYLDETREFIAARISALTDAAIGERPAWMTMLGQPPGDARARDQWLRHVAIIAAFRDEQRITTSDAHQVLGPYLKSGHAGNKAYWYAAESVLKARRLSGLDQPRVTQHGQSSADTQAVARARTVTDVYRGLPQAKRAEIASEVAARAGVLWFGDRLSADEDAVVQRAYADLLTAELTARGHLAPQAARLSNLTGAEPVEAHFARRHEVKSSSSRPGRTPVNRTAAPAEIPSQQRIPRVDKCPGLQRPQHSPAPRTGPTAPVPGR
jgi:hypothetical protein